MMDLDQQTFEELLAGDLPLIVDFWADWCMPCKIFAPVVEELADQWDGKAAFGKINIDELPHLAAKYGVASIPTLILFKNGQPAEQTVGVVPKKQLEETFSAKL